jgi:GST-like protein
LIKFYYSLGPNPMKVALFLEESGLRYERIPVDALRGEQFSADYLKINPNGKVPAIVDESVVVFDSNAILLYLGHKTGMFMPPDDPAIRASMLSWTMFIASGLGPFTGQAVHFNHYAPADIGDYSKKRYNFEARRHFAIVDRRLQEQPYMLGNEYTIVDMQLWGWARAIPYALGEHALQEFPSIKRVVEEISGRPAAQRATTIKHQFKTDLDEAARKFAFRHVQ